MNIGVFFKKIDCKDSNLYLNYTYKCYNCVSNKKKIAEDNFTIDKKDECYLCQSEEGEEYLYKKIDGTWVIQPNGLDWNDEGYAYFEVNFCPNCGRKL